MSVVRKGSAARPIGLRERVTRSCAGDGRARVDPVCRPGFTMVELLIVMVLGAIMVTIAMPRFDLRRFRIEAAVRDANLTMLGAQRLAIQKQHNVVVAFDTVRNLIRIHQDSDNDGVMDAGEMVRQRPLGDGVRFGLGGATARAIGGAPVTFIRSQGGWPAVTFSRAGTGSEIGGFYISSTNSGSPGVLVDTRVLEVERATGRTERFRWEPTTNTWTRAF